MQISQIFFTDSNSSLSPHLQVFVEKAKCLSPHLNHVLYSIDSGREFIRAKLGNEVLDAFDRLNPYAYKADLLRYCLLYSEGGWYIDVGVELAISTINVPESIETIAFKDMPIISQTTWTCQCSVLYAKPNLTVYRKAIDLVVENCKSNYYGINALCPTGPSVIGRAFAIDGAKPNRIFGDFIPLTPMHNDKNPAYVLPDGLIFAFGKKTGGGDLKGLGAVGTNNYNDFYNAKTVYKF